MHTLLAIFFGMLLGNAAVLYAAEEIPADVPEADTSDDQTAEEMLAAEAALEAEEARAAGADDEAGSESTGPAGTEAPETAASRRSGSDDEDFVPSIQISEDLSVSFPVDI